MTPKSPVIPGENLDEIKVAEHQPEYQTLPVVVLAGGNILSRWQMDEAERNIVRQTGELYICLLTFGMEPPETLFQVDCPIVADSPDLNLKAKTAYPGSSLPVFAADDQYVWMILKLTDEDRETVANEGNVYFFMKTDGRPVTPSMIQVEKPDFHTPDIEFIVGVRASEKTAEMAARHGVETAKYLCTLCRWETFVSKQLAPRIDDGDLKVMCTICAKENDSEYCLLPETVGELQSVIENGTNSQN